MVMDRSKMLSIIIIIIYIGSVINPRRACAQRGLL